MKVLNNLNISKKMMIAFGITIVFLAVSVLLALTQVENVKNNYQETIDTSVEFLTELEETEKEVNFIAMLLRQLALFGFDETVYNELAEPIATLNETLEHMKGLYPFADSDLTNYINTIHQWETLADPIVNAVRSGDLDTASEIIQYDCTPAIQSVNQLGGALLVKMENYNADYIANLTSTTNITTIVIVIISGVAIGVAVFIAIAITKGITKPIIELEGAITAFSEGDLRHHISYESKDELGQIAVAVRESQDILGVVLADIVSVTDNILKGNLDFSISRDYPGQFTPIKTNLNSLIDYMNNIMLQIRTMSVQVSEGSQQVSNASQMLAQGSIEQTSSVMELSSNIKSISEQINDNYEDAKAAGEMAQATTDAITLSNERMVLLMESMNEIDEQSKEISKIIKTIDDIAFQTNILALNAAVEAARAGSAGKGFAVVADEVRNLAAKSADAAKSTGALIESSINSINKGVSLAQDATSNSSIVVEQSEKTSSLMDKIIEASNAQSNAINQVTHAIDQISSVVQTNSATSEESAASSEELSSQSINMQNMIQRFKIKE